MSARLLRKFDRSKPFYPIVMGYLMQVIGAKELALRGQVGPRPIDQMMAIINAKDLAAGQPLGDQEKLARNLIKISGNLQLRSEVSLSPIEVDVDEIAEDVFDNHAYLLPTSVSASAFALTLAHEVSKGKPWHTADPIWEFLFHCRNAVAHGGRFDFRNGHPKRPAHWQSFAIDASWQGRALLKHEGGILSPGDPIILLWDIEQAFPAMTVTLGVAQK